MFNKIVKEEKTSCVFNLRNSSYLQLKQQSTGFVKAGIQTLPWDILAKWQKTRFTVPLEEPLSLAETSRVSRWFFFFFFFRTQLNYLHKRCLQSLFSFRILFTAELPKISTLIEKDTEKSSGFWRGDSFSTKEKENINSISHQNFKLKFFVGLHKVLGQTEVWNYGE